MSADSPQQMIDELSALNDGLYNALVLPFLPVAGAETITSDGAAISGNHPFVKLLISQPSAGNVMPDGTVSKNKRIAVKNIGPSAVVLKAHDGQNLNGQ